MKLVKDLQKWIEGYNELKTLADELELAFDFYKEELVTEEDVDAAYAKASEAVEALELKFRCRWYGKSGLGFHADAYVSALCRDEWL